MIGSGVRTVCSGLGAQGRRRLCACVEKERDDRQRCSTEAEDRPSCHLRTAPANNMTEGVQRGLGRCIVKCLGKVLRGVAAATQTRGGARGGVALAQGTAPHCHAPPPAAVVSRPVSPASGERREVERHRSGDDRHRSKHRERERDRPSDHKRRRDREPRQGSMQFFHIVSYL